MGTIAIVFVILLVVGYVLTFMPPGRLLFDTTIFIVLLFLLLGQLGVLGG